MNQPIELLAPAGTPEKLRFAIHYGADAVYLAGPAFGLRAYAGNFSEEELAEAVAYAHAHGVKVHVTVNMYPHNDGLIGLEAYAHFLESLQVDALIVADPGVYRILQQCGIQTPIHISTQATIVNWSGVQFWQDQPHVERVVLARELSLEEIRTIHDKTGCELESFIHGAMCMSYSGRCLLSNYMTGRDANQGECAQSCRWGYALVEEKRPGLYYPIEEDANGAYIFNSHDLCTLEYLEDILAAGVNSLKIEGRMKSIYYTSTILRAYRHVLDDIIAGRTPDLTYWRQDIEKVSHRPYTSGFYYGRPEDHAVDPSFSGYIQPYDFVGVVKDYDPATGFAEIEQRNKVVIGDTIQFFGRNYREQDVTIDVMWDENHTPIESAPRAQQTYYLRLPFAVEAMDIIRKARADAI